MEFDEIIFETKSEVATITLNRPDIRNAISGRKMIKEFVAACSYVNAHRTVKVLIITGADPAFSSGGNIKDMAERKGMFHGTPEQIRENYRQHIQKIPLTLQNIEVPTIAAVNGSAMGAGCDLALMCDIRVASEKAEFGETFLNIGLIPGDGGAYFLPRVVGMAKACELTFTGEVIDAGTALEIGMVNHVVEHKLLMEKANALALKIASKPHGAMRMAKKLLTAGQTSSLPELLEQSAHFQALCHETQDHKEALKAILEKRKPRFTGK